MVSESAFSFKQVGSGEVGMWEAAVNQGLEHMQAEKGDALREGAVKLKKKSVFLSWPCLLLFFFLCFSAVVLGLKEIDKTIAYRLIKKYACNYPHTDKENVTKWLWVTANALTSHPGREEEKH